MSDLERIVSDEALRRRLAEAGPLRARQFTWERAAERALQVLIES